MKVNNIVLKLYKIAFTFTQMIIENIKINPLQSHIHGYISNTNGLCIIKSGLRNKRNLNISINNGKLIIKENVFFNNNCSINVRESIEIGRNTIFGEGVLLYDHDHDYSKGINHLRSSFITAPIVIGENVWIGSNSIILKGVTIGNNCIIAAGSIITRDIPNNTIIIQKRTSKFYFISEH
ncbi:acyltransferase [Proteus vulgaris]|uniref:acyltransferase n=1 Tax=Proteus vulgaris TaxID=585 RepID=UPI0025409EE4|nr:acyltransferase [Proteus vulgaris]WIF72397.1 acyltransferase [Proteus vulgaris]